jgi:hypothetical protein
MRCVQITTGNWGLTVRRQWLFPFVALAALWTVWMVFGTDTEHAGFEHCLHLTQDRARLACYDAIAAPRQPARGAIAPSPQSDTGS